MIRLFALKISHCLPTNTKALPYAIPRMNMECILYICTILKELNPHTIVWFGKRLTWLHGNNWSTSRTSGRRWLSYDVSIYDVLHPTSQHCDMTYRQVMEPKANRVLGSQWTLNHVESFSLVKCSSLSSKRMHSFGSFQCFYGEPLLWS